MALSIVFPAFNEEQNIENAIQEALTALEGKEGEVIVVNDGSTDHTGEIATSLQRKYSNRVKVMHHPTNQGYAATLRDGFLAAKFPWVFYSDSDLQFHLSEIELLWPLSDGADMVVGYRKDRQDPPFRIFAAGCYNRLVRTMFGIAGVRDIDCAFKLFRRDVFDRIQIESKDFLIDAELIIKGNKQKMVIREVGVTHLPRKHGKSTVRLKHVFNTLTGLFKLFFEMRRK